MRGVCSSSFSMTCVLLRRERQNRNNDTSPHAQVTVEQGKSFNLVSSLSLPFWPISPYNPSMENREIARILHETAQLLEIDGAIIGRYRSYEKAAELIYSLHERVEELAKDRKKLTELPGIGDNMAEHIDEIIATGDYGLRKKLLKKYPVTMLEVLSLQGLGPKKAAFLWKEFKASTVEAVAKLAREQKLREVPGFGEKSEELSLIHISEPTRP